MKTEALIDILSKTRGQLEEMVTKNLHNNSQLYLDTVVSKAELAEREYNYKNNKGEVICS